MPSDAAAYRWMAASLSFLSPAFACKLAQYSASFKHPLSCKEAKEYTFELAPPPTRPVSTALDPSRASRYGAFSISVGMAAPVLSSKLSMDFDTPMAQYLTRKTVTKHNSNCLLSSAPPPTKGRALAPLGEEDSSPVTSSAESDKSRSRCRLLFIVEVEAAAKEPSSLQLSSVPHVDEGRAQRSACILGRDICVAASAKEPSSWQLSSVPYVDEGRTQRSARILGRDDICVANASAPRNGEPNIVQASNNNAVQLIITVVVVKQARGTNTADWAGREQRNACSMLRRESRTIVLASTCTSVRWSSSGFYPWELTALAGRTQP